MSDFEHEYYEPLIFDPAYCTIVSDPVAPQFTFVAFQCFAEATRILGSCDPVPKIVDDSNFDRTIKLT